MILKLPHRSDALAYVECVVSLREHHLISYHDDLADYGVRGITVVNALKTPVPRQGKQDTAISHTPPWYADPDSWGDAQGKLYQMSGRLVGAYRNQILAGLMSGVKALRDLGLEIWISGGLTSQKEVQHCLELEKIGSGEKGVISGIQIGTWALLDTDITKNGEKNWCVRLGPPGPGGQYQLDVSHCKKDCCTDIHESCPYGALERKEKGKPVVVTHLFHFEILLQ